MLMLMLILRWALDESITSDERGQRGETEWAAGTQVRAGRWERRGEQG